MINIFLIFKIFKRKNSFKIVYLLKFYEIKFINYYHKEI